MSKHRINFQKGGYYHITNRTASGLVLFIDDQDYQAFDRRLEYYAAECNLTIIAKSLMPTHYHLLVRQDGEINPSKFTQKLSISYFKFYTKRYNHHGAIFGQRFKAIEITSVFQMRNTCCYIHANAYKAELVDNPMDWLYGDLALFYNKEFWLKQTDAYLLESFDSLAGFIEAFETYLKAMQLFQAPTFQKKKNYPKKKNRKPNNKKIQKGKPSGVVQLEGHKNNKMEVGESPVQYERQYCKIGFGTKQNGQKKYVYIMGNQCNYIKKITYDLKNYNPSSYG